MQALALWLAFAIYPQASGEISGHVTAEIEAEATNQPIQGAQIRLYSLEQVLSTKSSASGDFVFKNVPFGDYTLVVQASGFKPFRKSVMLTEKAPASFVKVAIAAAMDPSNCNAPSISYADYKPSPTGHLSLKASGPRRSLAGVVFSIKGPARATARVYRLVDSNGAADTALSPGSYTVSVDGTDFHKQQADVFVPRDNITVMRFSMVRRNLQVVCQ